MIQPTSTHVSIGRADLWKVWSWTTKDMLQIGFDAEVWHYKCYYHLLSVSQIDQMVLFVASAVSSSTKIRSLSRSHIWTRQTCSSFCHTNCLSALAAWVWQLPETRNLPYQPWCRHKPHCTHRAKNHGSFKSGICMHMLFSNLQRNKYMLSCMVVSGLVPTSAICHGVCEWCAFELHN